MKLREYEYILAIAREKTMTQAAQSLCVSQPTLSRVLASVEADLDMQLFHRCRREMVPTKAGRVFLETIREIVALNDRLNDDLKNANARPRTLFIACPFIRTSFMIKRVFKLAHQEMPEIRFQVVNISQTTILNGLTAGEYPLAFGIIRDEHERRFSYQIVASEEMVLAVHKNHPLAAKAVIREDCTYPFVNASLLAHEPFVLSREHAFSSVFSSEFFEAEHISPPIVARVQTTSHVLQAVSAGLGSAIIPSVPHSTPEQSESITYLSIRDRSATHAIGILFRKNHILTKDEEHFIEILRRVYREGTP